MDIEKWAVAGIGHLKHPVEQMMELIGQEQTIVCRRHTEEKADGPERELPPAVQKRKEEPGRADQADPDIGDGVEHIFHLDGGGIGEQKLGNAPHHHQELAGGQRPHHLVPAGPDQEPAGGVGAEDDREKIGKLEKDVGHGKRPPWVCWWAGDIPSGVARDIPLGLDLGVA